MFWADRITEEIIKKHEKTIASGTPLVVRDEKTASGRVHVGSMRGVAIHGVIADELKKKGISTRFIYEINDIDPMDGLPVYLSQEKFQEHMGKPLYAVPSPDGKAKNFAEYFAEEFLAVIREAGFIPDETPRASELYLSGKMNDAIRTALQNADTIRTIYKDVSRSVKDENWLPINVICEKCGKIGTTKATHFDGERVTYTCEKSMVEWAEGCGHSGTISPFNGNAKLPWKVEWAAKFLAYGVHVEGAGKDHSTKGGARDIANHIAKEVYHIDLPYDIPYEFFLIGGKKMSSSKGAGASAREIADLMPKHIFRLSLLQKEPKRALEFNPEGDTLPLLFDAYDRLAEKYGTDKDDDTRLFEAIHGGNMFPSRFLPRFSEVAYISQIPSVNSAEYFSKVKGSALTKEDLTELELRVTYAKKWIETCAPESYVFEIQKTLPTVTKTFTPLQKEALKKILEYVRSHKTLDGQELHTKLHELRAEMNIEPRELFTAIYQSFVGKESGPKAGWFLSVLERKFLEKRLEEAST